MIAEICFREKSFVRLSLDFPNIWSRISCQRLSWWSLLSCQQSMVGVRLFYEKVKKDQTKMDCWLVSSDFKIFNFQFLLK